MRAWEKFRLRLRSLVRRGRVEWELDDELRFHLEQQTAENIASGMTPEEARHAARRAIGGIEQIKEECRDARRVNWVDCVARDVGYSLRAMRKSPGFTVLAIATLALGIGANTALFSVYNAVALKPLPVADPDSVVRWERWFESGTAGDIQYAFSYPEFSYFRQHTDALAGIAAASWPVSVATETETWQGELVSGNYFAVLGVRARLGRTFLDSEDSRPGAHPVIVLSYRCWDRRFAMDPEILRRPIQLNQTVFTVIGVAPQEFSGTGLPPQIPDFWAPIAMQAAIVPGQDWLSDSDNHQYLLLGRLAPSASRNMAQAEAGVLMRRFARTHTEREKTSTITLPRATYFGNTDDIRFQALAGALMLLVGLVLLIACTNLANMLLARAAGRQREIAVRMSLGASRGRIIGLLLSESTAFSLMGGAAGFLFSWWSAQYLWMEIQETLSKAMGITISMAFGPDVRVLGYALVIALAMGIAAGLSPALQSSRTDLNTAIKEEGARLGQFPGRSRLRGFLVASQVTASVLLLAIAGLLCRGLLRAWDAQPGFETRRVFLVSADLGSDEKQAAALQQRLLERLAALPDVRSAAMGYFPMTGTWTPPIHVDTAQYRTLCGYASSDYFETLGIPLIRGRRFTHLEASRGLRVAVISKNAATRFWPNTDPVGKRFAIDMKFDGKLTEFEVIGVVQDARMATLSRIDPARVYLATNAADVNRMLIRIQGDRTRSLAAVRAATASLSPKLLPSLSVSSLEDGPLETERVLARTYALFAGILAALALSLAAIGIYGVMSYVVSRQTKEIGVRIALGADAKGVLRSVIGQGLAPVLKGSVVGLAAAAALSKLINSMLILPGSSDFLYGLPWWDPVTFGGVIGFVAFIAAVASAAPAVRALRVDPMVALRNE